MDQVANGGLPLPEKNKAGVSPMDVVVDDAARKKLLLEPKPNCPDREAAISMLPPLMDRLSCDSCDKDIKYVSVWACRALRWWVRTTASSSSIDRRI